MAVFGLVAVDHMHGLIQGDRTVNVPGNVLEAFPGDDMAALAMRTLMAMASVLVYPMLCLPCRSTLDHLLFRVCCTSQSDNIESGSSKMPARQVLETCFILCLTFGLSNIDSDLASVFGLTGATAGALICYVLPPICFLVLRSRQKEAERKATRLRALAAMALLTFITPLSINIVWEMSQQ